MKFILKKYLANVFKRTFQKIDDFLKTSIG
jgi:hypothetical protein